jgi:hypothetical protein
MDLLPHNKTFSRQGGPMLIVEMTPNLLGIKIAGDYDDLNELYDAIWALTIADSDFPEDKRLRGTADELAMSTRLLSLCYDIRHAYQGDRNVELKDNGLNEWTAECLGIDTNLKSVVFSVEVLYPEAMYEALILNYLMAKRTNHMLESNAVDMRDEWPGESLLDEPMAIVRAYLAKLLAAVGKQATKGRFERIKKGMKNYQYAAAMYEQWVDVINNDFAGMTKRRRAEELSVVVRDITECYKHDQYLDMKADIDRAAEKHGCHRSEIQIPGLYEWDDIEW